MKRILSLMLAIVLTLSAFASVNFASTNEGIKEVKKVVFRGLSSNNYTSIGGIRFYHDDNLIPSGDVITNTATYGETQFLSITASNGYWKDTDGKYYAVNAIRQDVPQLGTRYESYWLTDSNDQSLSIDFKQPSIINKIEFVSRPDPNIYAHSVTENFFVDITYSDNSVITYEVIPSSENNTIQTLELTEPVYHNTSLNVVSSTTTIKAGDTIDINLVLKDAKDIYAQDFTLNFDANAFEVIDSKISDEVSNKLYYSNSTEGNIRYVVGCNGKNYGINDEKSLVTVTLKAKNFSGETIVDFKNGLVADSTGNEFTVLNNGLKFNIEGTLKDVNNTGTFTLGDLSIACYLLDSDSSTWGSFTPDVDNSGVVDTLDLSKIVEEILKN